MAFNRVLPLLFYTGLLLGWLPVPSVADPPPKIIHETNRCIWYDECAQSNYGTDTFYNCLYNGRPKNLTEQSQEFIKLLNDTCPDIVAEGRGVCCNERQLNTLATQIKYPQQLFSRCPACLKNFIDHFCLTTCDPDQAAWMNVTDMKHDDDLNKWSILNIELFVTPEYAHSLYDSCKNVQYPQASTKVIDIMCGTVECNAAKWLAYLGNPNANHESPFPMEYRFTNETFADGIVPKSYDFIECNTTDKKYQCSCSDCDAPNVCPPPPQPFPNTFSYVHVMICIVCVGVSLSVLVFIVAMIAAIASIRSKRGYTNINKPSGGGQAQAKYGAVENENYSPTSSVGSINADETDLPKTEKKDQPPLSSSVCDCWFRMGRWIEYAIKCAFYHWGKFVAEYWYIVFIFAAIIAIIFASGSFFFFKITTAPVDLWTSSTSRARQEKIYFDEHFSPFYRTEMLIITAPKFNNTYYQPFGVPNANYTFGPVFDLKVLEEVLHLQNNLTYMEVPYTEDDGNETITLSDICLKPLAPQNDYCTIMSILNYFQNSIHNLNRQYDFMSDYHDHIYYCTRNPTDPKGANFKNPYMPCLGEFGGPVDPNVALGGFGFEPNSTNPDYQSAKALMVTFIVRNHINESNNRRAEAWEKAFLKFVGNYTGQYINITYSAERSIEDEIERESQAEILTILISYILMFVYIMFFLGHIRSIRTLLVDIKISIGFIGVLTVLVAVLVSIGLLSYLHVMNTLIILEVVPFLVLAVGVDNFFILIHSYEREACKFARHHKHDMSRVSVKELIGRSVGEVAPSILLTSLSETAAFLLGGVSTMPAVRSFSFYAGVAVFFNFLLQISVFVGLMALDAHRQLANRVDLFFCFKLKGNYDPTMGRDIIHFFIKYFAKLILHPLVRPFVLLFFGLTSTGALALLFRTEIGLDQTLALPRDSYLMPYFNETFTYLHTGAPVYFVIKDGYDYTNETKQNAICSGAGCNPTSLGQQIVWYSTAANMTKIAEPSMLWLDTYFEWITPTSLCCGISRDEHGDECYDPKWQNDSCDACMVSGGDRPNKTEFETYIYWFLQDNPGIACPSGGHAAFGGAVVLNETDKQHHKNSTVLTSYVMTYHTVLKTSDDFISALRWARRLADNVSSVMEWEVFPYSVFYVFYEQYLTTVHDMALNLGLSIGAVFIVTLLMFGLNLWAALILMLVVCMIILHMFGCMHLLGINANAISLVNLVMTVGISVEFCSHIVRWFVSHVGRRRERAQSALDHMGASVFSGITVTKFLGVFVLLFAKSKLFNIYYFRMYMLMLFWGALHGLIFLPVILSYIGPPNVNFIKKPYSDLDLEEEHEEEEKPYKTSTTKAASEGDKRKPNDIPPQSRHYPSVYPPPRAAVPPTQPTVPSQHPQVYQGYGPPTYPNQQVYQQQGVAYGAVPAHSERTRLINQ